MSARREAFFRRDTYVASGNASSGLSNGRFRNTGPTALGPKAMGWTPPHPNGINVPDWKRYRPVNGEKESTMKLMRVGIDLAKAVFQVHGVDRNEKVTLRRKLTRANWLEVLLDAVEPGCVIGMEACGGAHHWARALQARGLR